jgi:hypothetical protein
MQKSTMPADSKLRSFPFHSFGVIIFFLTHGYSENVALIPFKNIFFFWLEATAICVFLLYFFKRICSSWSASGIITSLILVFYLFYGAIQDSLKGSAYLAGLSKYRILLPLGLLLILTCLYFIRRSGKTFSQLTRYLNLLFVVLIVVDIVSVLAKSESPENKGPFAKDKTPWMNFVDCRDCDKPDIYLLLMDEYCGTTTLKNYFKYDNSWFISDLSAKGFFIASEARSNYTSTPLSVASTFEMNYIDWMHGRKSVQAEDYAKAATSITYSSVMKFLQKEGYAIKNYSIFDIVDQSSPFDLTILPLNLRLITSKTLLGRIDRDLLWVLRTRVAPSHPWLMKKFQDQYKKGNQRILELTQKEILAKPGKPRFIYAHFMMPHFPCIYDSLGNEVLFKDTGSASYMEDAYLQYHVYATKMAKALIEKIQQQSNHKAVIIFMSDHGYRDRQLQDEHKLSANDNFYSIYLPSHHYESFYDSLSSVNQFRLTFNSLFKQKLPLLTDSCGIP